MVSESASHCCSGHVSPHFLTQTSGLIRWKLLLWSYLFGISSSVTLGSVEWDPPPTKRIALYFVSSLMQSFYIASFWRRILVLVMSSLIVAVLIVWRLWISPSHQSESAAYYGSVWWRRFSDSRSCGVGVRSCSDVVESLWLTCGYDVDTTLVAELQ